MGTELESIHTMTAMWSTVKVLPVDRHCLQALQHMQLMPGLLELCSFLEAQGLPRSAPLHSQMLTCTCSQLWSATTTLHCIDARKQVL